MICLVRLYDDRSKDPWRAESLEGEITLGLRFTKFNHGIVDPSIPAKRSMAKITLYFSFDEMFPAIRDLNPIQKSLNRVPLDLSFFTTAKAPPHAISASTLSLLLPVIAPVTQRPGFPAYFFSFSQGQPSLHSIW